MKEDILDPILQAEKEYHGAMKNAVLEAEVYVEECKEKQAAYVEKLNREWYIFEKAEKDKFEKRLLDAERRLEAETAALKEKLKNCQKIKAESISERFKREVLSLYGGN